MTDEAMHEQIQAYAVEQETLPPGVVVTDWMIAGSAVSYDDDGDQRTHYFFVGKDSSAAHSLIGLARYAEVIALDWGGED